MLLKIGQLARQTGLTVRTLHHYDAIGLLRPSGRADNGYRLYDHADVARLYRIQTLRRLGLGLEETGAMLADAGADAGALVARQIAQLNAQIDHATQLRDRLLQLQEVYAASAEPDLGEWLATLELMAILDHHLTPEETGRWHTHAQETRGAEAAAWTTLLAQIRALLDAGVPPEDPRAQDCARRWLELNDPHLKRSPQLMLKVDALYRADPALQAVAGPDRALVDYLGTAATHYRLGLYAPHLEPAQLAAVRPRYLNGQGGWTALTRDLRALMENGTPPAHPDAAAACLRWRRLFADCFGSDPDIQARILHAQATDPLLAVGSTWNDALRAWLRAGLAHVDAAAEARRV